MSQNIRSYSPQKSENKSERLRVLVGMSGGIHSAVTAALLKTQGHDVVGLYLELKVPQALGGIENHCSNGNSRANAEKAASVLGIDFQIADVSGQYDAMVLDAYVHEALLGQSYNPCVACNRDVKLATLFKKSQEFHCDKAATGHGAQLLHDPRTGSYQLLQASDPTRDQSSFLFTLSQDDLSKLLLPLGNFPRAMVSRLAAEYGFQYEASPSQSICFSSAQKATAYIESRVAPTLRTKGVVKTTDAAILGEHQGVHRYRHGDPVAVTLSAEQAEGKVVVDMDLQSHALILGTPEHLLKKNCLLLRTRWLRPFHGMKALRCQARLAPGGPLFACQVTFFENQNARVDFDEPRGPLFPGQTIVFYQDNEVLGGGWIRRSTS
jgi:tRNA-specific 2-thiouridylase